MWGRSIEFCEKSQKLVLGTLIGAPIFAYLVISYFHEISFDNYWNVTLIGSGWIFFQSILAICDDFLHLYIKNYRGGIHMGQPTPAGNQLIYNINGLQSFIISVIVFLLIPNKSYVARNFGTFFIFANVFGYWLSILAYMKAIFWPTHSGDVKKIGIFSYDFFWGMELNPRTTFAPVSPGPSWSLLWGYRFREWPIFLDWKLFFNGRPGIIAWGIINFSFMILQYELHGYISSGMILVNVLQIIYIVDFFWHEAWYLKTIDIAHDHFGWYFAWGSSVWLPFMYTLQAQYIAYYPYDLGLLFFPILFMGLTGYAIFRRTNNQKDSFRAIISRGEQPIIWKKPAKYLKCYYKTSDGVLHQSYLLTSGFWGIARHMNYMGDLLLSASYCFCTGFENNIGYFYFVYMLIFLILRCLRDEHRCSKKYGKTWDEYCRIVPFRLFPGIF